MTRRATGTPRVFGAYALVRRISVSATAEIFEARLQQPSGTATQRVTLKRLLPHAQEDAGFVARFVAEGVLLGTLDHPRVATLVSAGVHRGSHYMVSPYVDGRDLRVFVRAAEPRPSARLVAAVGAQMADALGYVHRVVGPAGEPRRIVHRDVSPHNIIVGPAGRLTLIDFGIAKHRESRVRTATGTIQAKLGYASPEQVRGEPLDPRSDIFSLGVVLWEVATGRRLFGGGGMSPHATLERVEAAEIPTSGGEPTDGALASAPLDRLIRAMLARRACDRPQDCDVLSEVFGVALDGHDAEAIVADHYNAITEIAPTPIL